MDVWFLPPSPCLCPACLWRQLCSFLFLHSLSCTQHRRCSCCIWIISAKKRWQELDPESGTQGWEDNSCKCHQGGQGLTSLKLPVGETDGRERWHLTSLEPRDVLHINMQTHLIRFIWPRVCVFKPAYCDRKGQSRAGLRPTARLPLGRLISSLNGSSLCCHVVLWEHAGYLKLAVFTHSHLILTSRVAGTLFRPPAVAGEPFLTVTWTKWSHYSCIWNLDLLSQNILPDDPPDLSAMQQWPDFDEEVPHCQISH